MPVLPGNDIVQFAVGLLRKAPDRPAIEILDHAMQRGGCPPSPVKRGEGGARTTTAVSPAAYLDPPSPFAELLRRAFAPGMDPRELALAGLHGKSDEPELREAVAQAADRWQGVMDLFAERYRLCEAGG